jgi:[protein-PII] uridylyltransferase
VLDQMGLNVVDARLILNANGFSLETYVVLEDSGGVINEPSRIAEIERGLGRALKAPEDAPLAVTRRAPRQVRMFSTPTQVNFSLDARNHRTILELVAADRPGLLSEVGKVFRAERVAINGAKIMTVGERAEDVFYITETDGSQLQEPSFQRVKDALIRALDRREGVRA